MAYILIGFILIPWPLSGEMLENRPPTIIYPLHAQGIRKKNDQNVSNSENDLMLKITEWIGPKV